MEMDILLLSTGTPVSTFLFVLCRVMVGYRLPWARCRWYMLSLLLSAFDMRPSLSLCATPLCCLWIVIHSSISNSKKLLSNSTAGQVIFVLFAQTHDVFSSLPARVRSRLATHAQKRIHLSYECFYNSSHNVPFELLYLPMLL